MLYTSYLEMGDHKSLSLLVYGWHLKTVCSPACDPDPDSSPCIPESSSHLLLTPVQDLLVYALEPLV